MTDTLAHQVPESCCILQGDRSLFQPADEDCMTAPTTANSYLYKVGNSSLFQPDMVKEGNIRKLHLHPHDLSFCSLMSTSNVRIVCRFTPFIFYGFNECLLILQTHTCMLSQLLLEMLLRSWSVESENDNGF